MFQKLSLSTFFILLLTFLVGLLPVKTEFPKLIKQDIDDYDLYDLHFTRSESTVVEVPSYRDTNIVLLQIGQDRQTIVRQLYELIRLAPRVIAVDALFRQPSADSSADQMLRELIESSESIIVSSRLEKDDSTGGLFERRSFFDSDRFDGRHGYDNFIGERTSTVRSFAPFYRSEGRDFVSFAARVVEKYRKDDFDYLRKRGKTTEFIQYKGNIEQFYSFTRVDFFEFLATGQLEEKVRGRIVLLGHFEKPFPNSLEDLHFTPLNEQVGGRSFPDMYGVVIQANIVQMMLNKDYITKLAPIYSYMLAALLIFVVLWAEYRWEKKKGKAPPFWFHLGEAVLLVLLVFLLLLLFSGTGIRFALYPIIFSFVAKGFYMPVYNWVRLILVRWRTAKTKKVNT